MTHLNDISKVYMEKVAKPDFLDLDKDGNKKEPMKKAAVEAPKERLKTDRDGYRVPKKDADAARERLLAKARAKRAKMSEALDPVGKEDADVDNDGKKNTKSDKYLLNRRKAIAKAIKEAKHDTAKQMHSPHEVPSGNLKGLVKKAVKRIDTDVDGDTDKNDKAKGELGEFIPGVGNKRLYSTTKTTTAKESFSNWRQDLREIVDEYDEDQKQVKEKKVKNNIKINPKISEEVTILEMVEISEDQEIETLSHAVDFFFEEGINDDGLEMIIEDLGLEEFVDLVYDIGYETISEARTLVTKKKTPKKLPKGTAPAKTTKARVAKSGTTMKAAAPSGAFKRRPAAAKAVETARQEQPKKKPVRDAIARGIFRAVDAYKAGMERHRQATKGMGKAARKTGKTVAKAASVTHEAGRRVGQTQAGKAVKKAGSKAIKTGVEKAKEAIKSLKKEELELQEKSLSISQQQAAGAALAAKRGEIDPSELKGASIQMYKSMSEKELRDFAKTKHKGLPKKKEVEEAVEAPKRNDKKQDLLKQQQLSRQKQMLQKIQMLQRQRLQMQKQGKLPIGSAMEETEVIDERRREDKGKPRPAEPSAAFKAVSKMMGSSRLGVQPRGVKKEPGKKPPVAGEFGAPRSPAQKVAAKRAAKKRSQDMIHSRFD